MPEATVSDGLVDSMGKMQLKMQWWKQEAHQDSQRSTGQYCEAMWLEGGLQTVQRHAVPLSVRQDWILDCMEHVQPEVRPRTSHANKDRRLILIVGGLQPCQAHTTGRARRAWCFEVQEHCQFGAQLGQMLGGARKLPRRRQGQVVQCGLYSCFDELDGIMCTADSGLVDAEDGSRFGQEVWQ
jgi:hypothetical protein